MPITKTELFDVDVLQKLIIKDGITQKDKADLQRYRRRRINGNQVLIAYDYPKDYKGLKVGRMYPSPHLGLAVFPKDIRAALAQKYYWDIDIENAQPNLLVGLAKKYSVECPALQEFCEKRSEILEQIQASENMNRDEAKTICLSVLFGGFRSAHPLLPQMFIELKELSLKVAAEYPKIYSHCKSNPNPHASCLSIIIQDEERKVLELIDESMAMQGRSMDVLIFDGGLVRKLENETDFPMTLLSIIEKYVFEKTGYTIHLAKKPLTHTFEFGSQEILYPASTVIDDRFACDKFVSLNPDIFMRDGNSVFMRHPTTGLWQSYSLEDAKQYVNSCHGDLVFRQESGIGIKKFNYGGSIKNVTAMLNWMPQLAPPGKVPIEFLGSLGTADSNGEIVTLYLELLSLIANHNEETKHYLINYLAHTIQYPRDLPGVCLVVTGGQGCGKDTTFDLFMNYVLGSFYTANLKNEVFFSPYDDLKARKVMVKLEEANSKYCMENSDALKNLITGRTVSFNPKHKSPFEAENFCRYIFTTNAGNPIAIEGLDRRYVFLNASDDKMGDAEFWAHVYQTLANEEAGRVLYTYFKSIDLSEFTPRVFPINEYQAEVREEYKSLERRFVEEWDGEEVSVDEFYRLYVAFCRRMKLKDDAIPNKIAFGKKLLTFYRDKIIQKRRRNDGIYYSKFMTETNPTPFL